MSQQANEQIEKLNQELIEAKDELNQLGMYVCQSDWDGHLRKEYHFLFERFVDQASYFINYIFMNLKYMVELKLWTFVWKKFIYIGQIHMFISDDGIILKS